MGYGQKVEHRICRSAHGYVERHGVLEGGLGSYRAWQDRVVTLEVVPFGILDDELGGTCEQTLAVFVRGYDSTVAGQCQTYGLVEAVHRVGGKHPRT